MPARGAEQELRRVQRDEVTKKEALALFNKHVSRHVLICIIKEKNFDRPFLIDHNIEVFKEGLLKIL